VSLGLTDIVRSIPFVEPAATHAVGLIVSHREPMTPLLAALVTEARALAKILGQTAAAVKNQSENKPLARKRGSQSAEAAGAKRRY